MTGEVRLKAEGAEDIDVLSTLIQDATIRVGDIAWLKSSRRFAAVINRYRWEQERPKGGDKAAKPERVRSALRFENILRVAFQNVPVADKDHVLGLLAVRVANADNDENGEGGLVTLELDFSGFASIRLEAECIEAYLEDRSQPWRAIGRPSHNIEAEEPDAGPDIDEAFGEG